jgi:hypothetical protein
MISLNCDVLSTETRLTILIRVTPLSLWHLALTTIGAIPPPLGALQPPPAATSTNAADSNLPPTVNLKGGPGALRAAASWL